MATTENDRKQPKTTFVFFIGILAALGLGFLGGRRSVTHSLLERVDTLVIRDTFVDYRPNPASVTPLRVEVVSLPLAGRLAFARFADDSASAANTVLVPIHDTVEVEVPIMFSRYKSDNYDIGVSGFKTELEYVKVYPQTKIVTRGYVERPKRWGFGVAVGPSVLVTPSGRVNAGLGVTGGFYLRL